MAVGMIMEVPGGSAEFYDAVMEAMEWGRRDPPPGLLQHFAGQGPNGWMVVDVWESKEDFGHFAEDRLVAAIEQVMPGAPQIDPRFFEIHNQERIEARV